jgi:hypothetical protein
MSPVVQGETLRITLVAAVRVYDGLGQLLLSPSRLCGYAHRLTPGSEGAMKFLATHLCMFLPDASRAHDEPRTHVDAGHRAADARQLPFNIL